MNNTIQVALTMGDELRLMMQELLHTEFKKYIPPPIIVEEYLTAKQVSEILGITLPTVNSYSLSGLLKAYRMGRKVRYKRSELNLALTPFKL